VSTSSTDYPDPYPGWLSLREIDITQGREKGAAFRAFKRLLPELNEGRDFVTLDHRSQSALAARLHAAGRVYRGTVNPVLLSPAAAGRVAAALSQVPASR
jgi:hypothetical protein